MNFDGLFGVSDVKPSAVGFPAFRKHLNQHASERRVGNVRHAFPIGFHIQFHGLVFLDLMLFDVFEIDAGIFNRYFLSATGDFNGDACLWIGFGLARLGFRSRGRGILRHDRAHQDKRCRERSRQQENSGNRHHLLEHHPLRRAG